MTTDSLIKCKACGQEVSSEASICIHCGHPLKKRNYRVAITGVIVLVSAAILGWHFISTFISTFISVFDGRGGLPSCDSSRGQSGAKQAIENSPLAKTLSIAIIAMSDAKTISATTEKVECKATVILNSAEKGIIDYSFTNEPALGRGKYYIRSVLEPDSLQPFHDTHIVGDGANAISPIALRRLRCYDSFAAYSLLGGASASGRTVRADEVHACL
jgi:hypothetical protein